MNFEQERNIHLGYSSTFKLLFHGRPNCGVQISDIESGAIYFMTARDFYSTLCRLEDFVKCDISHPKTYISCLPLCYIVKPALNAYKIRDSKGITRITLDLDVVLQLVDLKLKGFFDVLKRHKVAKNQFPDEIDAAAHDENDDDDIDIKKAMFCGCVKSNI